MSRIGLQTTFVNHGDPNVRERERGRNDLGLGFFGDRENEVVAKNRYERRVLDNPRRYEIVRNGGDNLPFEAKASQNDICNAIRLAVCRDLKMRRRQVALLGEVIQQAISFPAGTDHLVRR